MIAARRDFFDAGHYEPLADALARVVLDALPPRDDHVVLDAGCGEGYYLRRLRDIAVTAADSGLARYGVDVSKHGVSVAAKRDPAGRYAVASSHVLPVPPAALDVVITHFSPIFAEAFRRSLRPGGFVIVGAPGPGHLFALKQMVYENPQRHDDPNEELAGRGFVRVDSHRVRYGLQVRNARDVANLLAMTPLYWSASPAAQARLSAYSELDTEVDVVINVYRVAE